MRPSLPCVDHGCRRISLRFTRPVRLLPVRCCWNQSRVSSVTRSSVPGSSKRWVAPGTISSAFSHRSCSKAERFIPITGSSSPPTIRSVGALTAGSAWPREIGPAAAGDDRADLLRVLPGRGIERRPRAGARAEVADAQRRCLRPGAPASPWPRAGDPRGAGCRSGNARSGRPPSSSSGQQVDQQGGQPGVVERIELRTDCAGCAGCCRCRARRGQRLQHLSAGSNRRAARQSRC